MFAIWHTCHTFKLYQNVSNNYLVFLLEKYQEATMKVVITNINSTVLSALKVVKTCTTNITEEITRLRSHLTQFLKLVDDTTSQGRKLDFMCQELFREVNTIGSKSNHVGVAHAAVEAKVCVERMREIVQNVE